MYGSFSFPLTGLQPKQTDAARERHFTEIMFSGRVHIVNIVINKLLAGMFRMAPL